MKSWSRRRVLLAALASMSAGLLDWRRVAAQTPGRTLIAGPRPPAVQVGSDVAVLTAPRRALVIGNSSYALGALRNPANDARAIAEELGRQGFEVTLGLDLKRDEMLGAIGAYADAIARSKAVALFYFAGHGLQLAWRNYLVPVDARVESPEDIKARCVDVNAVIEGIGRAANPMNMVILDACRDNPFGRDAKTEQKGLSQLDAPPGTLLAYATSPGNIASDGEGANGLYTEHLLKEMQVPEAKIEDVFKRVRLGVRRRSQGQQIPWESTSLEQDFWFIPPREVLREAQEEAEDRDTRELRGEIKVTVNQLTDTEVIFDTGLVLDRLGNAVRLRDGRRFSPRQDQPLEYAVGRKWTTRFTVTTPKGTRSESHFNFKITGRERITVPAGTFECFVIEGEGYAISEYGFRIDLGLKRWMAPDRVRRPIASEQYRKVAGRVGAPPVLFRKKGKPPGGPGGLLNNERLELVAFRQA